MKWIKYQIVQSTINTGTESDPVFEDIIVTKKVGYSESNLAIAETEAYNGEYTIEEDEEVVNIGAELKVPLVLTKGIHYGPTLPPPGIKGRIYWIPGSQE